MTNPIKNEKSINASNKLNDLTAKEWLINTKSVWEYTDYHLNHKDRKDIRYLRNSILFFTKKNNSILNPNDNDEIKIIGEREGRIILSRSSKEVDFILFKMNKKFSNLEHYKKVLLSNEFKSKFIHYYNILKNNKYLCMIVRDFYFQNNSELILYHHDLANLLKTIGFTLKGLIVWICGGENVITKMNNPNNSIINDYILIFRKEKRLKESISKSKLKFQLNYDEKSVFTKETLYYKSYTKSISPPRDNFKAQHPATFPEPDIKNLIKFYTETSKRPKILDPFSGVGSTLIACLELNIEGYGIELTRKWIDLTKYRFFSRGVPININGKKRNPQQKPLDLYIDEEVKKKGLIQNLEHGDAIEKIRKFPDNYFDFIITSPPYWGILTKKIDHKTKKERLDKGFETKYTIEGKDETFHKDLANITSYKDFLHQLKIIYTSCYNKLKNDKYMAVIVSDFRDGPEFYLYHGDTANTLKILGFKLIGLTVLHQDSKNLYPYGYPYSFVSNIHHQFIIIVKKEEV